MVEWTSLRDQVERLASIATSMAAATASPSARRRRATPATAGRAEQVRARARTIADDARIRTYDVLGERQRALAILERRLASAST